MGLERILFTNKAPPRQDGRGLNGKMLSDLRAWLVALVFILGGPFDLVSRVRKVGYGGL